MKVCVKCNTPKVCDDFPKDVNLKDGFSHSCKSCWKEYSKEDFKQRCRKCGVGKDFGQFRAVMYSKYLLSRMCKDCESEYLINLPCYWRKAAKKDDFKQEWLDEYPIIIDLVRAGILNKREIKKQLNDN